MSNMTKSQKEKALITVAILFLLALSAYSYFAVYVPSRDAKLQAEQTLSSEREVLMALQKQLKEQPAGEKFSTSELQQKVSVEPLTDLIVLQVEQAELISRSLVESIEIAEGPLELLAPVEGVENIQEVLTSVTIEAPDYDSITTFIKEIEAMERIMVVEAIDFSANEEMTETGQDQEALNVTLEFSAFYRPDLIALAETQPKVAAPPPAKKNNPMPWNDGTDLADSFDEEAETNTDADAAAEEAEELVSAQVSNANPNVAGIHTAKYHKVEEGDTLSMISLKYYNSLEGEGLIKQANNMADQPLMIGTTLIIPERP